MADQPELAAFMPITKEYLQTLIDKSLEREAKLLQEIHNLRTEVAMTSELHTECERAMEAWREYKKKQSTTTCHCFSFEFVGFLHAADDIIRKVKRMALQTTRMVGP